MAFVLQKDTFNLADDYKQQYIGFRIPFSFGKEDNVLHDNTIDAIKDNLGNLFNTEPGERLFHPQLGASFRKYLFEQIDFDAADFASIVREDVTTQVKRWMPFLAVDDVKITTNPDRSSYKIAVDFHIIKNPAMHDSVEVTANVGGY